MQDCTLHHREGLKPDGKIKSLGEQYKKNWYKKLYTERINLIKPHIIFKNCIELHKHSLSFVHILFHYAEQRTTEHKI